MARADILSTTTTWTGTDIANLINGMDYGKESWCGVSGGTANAITLTAPLTPAAYADGQVYTFYANTTNTATATAAVSGLAATTIFDSRTGIALTGNEIFATGVYTLIYYNTKLYLLNGRDQEQTWSPTLVGFSANPTNTVYKYYKSGNIVTCVVRQTTAGTSNATSFTMTAPFTAATITNMAWHGSVPYAVDNGAAISGALVYITSGSSTITLDKSVSAAAWTNVNGKVANFTLTYEAA